MAVVGSRPRRNLLDSSQSRDSNALRASVLEAALELGISTSRPLADLIFNTVDEEDEVEVRIPFLRRFALPPAFFSSSCNCLLLGRLPNFLFLRIEQKLSQFDNLLSNGVLAVTLLFFVAHLYVVYRNWWSREMHVTGIEIPSRSIWHWNYPIRWRLSTSPPQCFTFTFFFPYDFAMQLSGSRAH
jgi:hypothetical protein